MPNYFTFEKIYLAYRDCCRGKSNTLSHIEFHRHLEQNLLKLELSLASRTYQPGQSIAFVASHPKTREIFAADFKDRVIHHLLCRYLEPRFEPKFIHDSYACRKSKGTHRAMLRLQQFTIETYSKTRPTYFLKMDIKSFFTSIDKHILYRIITNHIKNPDILWLTHVVIFHDCARDVPPKLQSHPDLFKRIPSEKSLFTVPRGKGLPIGNLTSQFFANVYLDKLDQFIKHKLKVKHYVRYVDDFVLLSDSPELLRQYQQNIEAFLARELKLFAHPAKTILRPVSTGIDFVGYIVRPDYILIRKRVAGQWRYKMDTTHGKARQQANASYLSHAKYANSRSFTKKMLSGEPQSTLDSN